jgi:hypothetical protein
MTNPSTRALVVVALLIRAAHPLYAQEPSPARRAHHSLVYDEANRRVLLWGGSSPFEGGNCCAMFNDLWSFNGTRWIPLGETGGKASGVGLAYDSRQNRVVGFGGYWNGQSLGSVQVLVNDAWTSRGRHPEAVAAEPGFVFDSRRNRFVAFGGSAGRGQAHGQTWEWDGTTWYTAAVPGPPARQGHVMVFDSKRNRVVLYGGTGSAGPGQPPIRYADTWEYDGTSWKQLDVQGPPTRASAGATFDSKRGVVLVFGGAGPDGMFGDTWSWDGTSWRKLSDTGPEARAMGYLAYDKQRDRVVLFGGRKGWPDDLNDTWEWDGTRWRQVAR